MNINEERLCIDHLHETEIEEAFAIKTQYLDDTPLEAWRELHDSYSDLFVRCRKHGRIIGVCYGWPPIRESVEPGTIILHGITIIEEYAGRGCGTALLRFFVEQVKEAGYRAVNVASAGGYVDHFYVKNGFEPTAFMICVPEEREFAPGLRTKHAVTAELVDGDVRRMYVSISSLDNALRNELIADFSALEVIAIMNKHVVHLGDDGHDNGTR